MLCFYTQEAFHVAKMAFRHFKIRVRKSLTPSYAGSNDFENIVSDYIICHLDLYDSQSSVNVSVGSLGRASSHCWCLLWVLRTQEPLQYLVLFLCDGRQERRSNRFPSGAGHCRLFLGHFNRKKKVLSLGVLFYS